MYYFNILLFKRLPSLLGMTQAELSDLCLGAKHKFARRIINQDSFPFQELIDTCNRLRISLANFITLNPNEAFLENKYNYIIPEGKFIPIEFKPKNIRFVYGPNGLGGNITRDDFANAMGVSLATITRWINPDLCSISLTEILKLCNYYKINISSFVEDKNKKLEEIEEEVQATQLPTRIWQEITELKQVLEKEREENRLLKQENEQLRITLKSDIFQAEESIENERQGKNIRKWIVNWSLLENLKNILGITEKELIKSVEFTNDTTTLEDMNIPLISLIKLCNKWHISIRHFFMRYNGTKPQIHKYSYYRSEKWKTIIFHYEYISDLFGQDALTNLNLSEIAELNEVGEATIRAWCTSPNTIRISDFIRLCNTLEVTPSCFISDNNRIELNYNMTYTEFLIEENRILRQRILRLKEKILK